MGAAMLQTKRVNSPTSLDEVEDELFQLDKAVRDGYEFQSKMQRIQSKVQRMKSKIQKMKGEGDEHDETEKTVKEQPLTDDGFQGIMEECCLYSLDLYTQRVVDNLGLEVCDDGCHNKFILAYHCHGEASTLGELEAAIVE